MVMWANYGVWGDSQLRRCTERMIKVGDRTANTASSTVAMLYSLLFLPILALASSSSSSSSSDYPLTATASYDPRIFCSSEESHYNHGCCEGGVSTFCFDIGKYHADEIFVSTEHGYLEHSLSVPSSGVVCGSISTLFDASVDSIRVVLSDSNLDTPRYASTKIDLSCDMPFYVGKDIEVKSLTGYGPSTYVTVAGGSSSFDNGLISTNKDCHRGTRSGKGKSKGKKHRGSGSGSGDNGSNHKYCRVNCFDETPGLPTPPYCPSHYEEPTTCGCCEGNPSSLMLSVLQSNGEQEIQAHGEYDQKLMCCEIDQSLRPQSGVGHSCKSAPSETCVVPAVEHHGSDYEAPPPPLLIFFPATCDVMSGPLIGPSCALTSWTTFQLLGEHPEELGKINTVCENFPDEFFQNSNLALQSMYGAENEYADPTLALGVVSASSSAWGQRVCDVNEPGCDGSESSESGSSSSGSHSSSGKGKGKGKKKGKGSSLKDENCCSGGMSALFFDYVVPSEEVFTETICTIDSWSTAEFVDCHAIKSYIYPTDDFQTRPPNPSGSSTTTITENGQELCLWTGDLDRKMSTWVEMTCVTEHYGEEYETQTGIHTSCSKPAYPGYYQEIGGDQDPTNDRPHQPYLAFTGGASLGYLDNESQHVWQTAYDLNQAGDLMKYFEPSMGTCKCSCEFPFHPPTPNPTPATAPPTPTPPPPATPQPTPPELPCKECACFAACECSISGALLPDNVRPGPNNRCEVTDMFGSFFDYDSQCDCSVYESSRRELTENETIVERLLADVEVRSSEERSDELGIQQLRAPHINE
ncbi:hypothetical protein TL16_g00899 [Triparma laevis f. inornata]|uniref:Uncharacterized protein n=1 Tax=Triparma laevis f. inornata TaxID=1714386 RepID=A0A9W6ZES6_9STRA|nr:hypothetical protein TL16_g00899 [Triparma laevis f. inornata]